MRELLNLLPRPSHYAGIESGAIHKSPDSVTLRIALAFPDTYEVGMSYLGHKILYGIINERPEWWAERVMAPDPQACAALRRHNAPLCTLESDTPLAQLDVIGFSVTHELCFTDILNMLDLAGIPLRSANRPESLAECPLVIAGGGAMLGAEPLAPFFDLVALGDGEELLPEILTLLEEAKREGWNRSRFLEQARHIPGVYVPAFFRERQEGGLAPVFEGYRPRRRIVQDLDATFYPQAQVAPVGAVHNRLSLEIGRGCARGCRFCHAGMVYRPVRERKPGTVATLLDNCLRNTGFDEVSFLALSAGDCTQLRAIYESAYERCQKEQTTLCLPSLRVGSVDDSIMAKMAELRRPGVTLAPEAGSQRLRDVINKGISEADFIRHLQKLIEHGWRQVKLYFMIGLPTETDADLKEILDLCLRARDAGGKGAPRLQITASVSPFVPKPFTPFQWEEQPPLEEMERRIGLLRGLFRGQKGLRLKWHDPASSHLEGILGRGDRRLADVVEKAFHKGAIFCGWSEYFDFAPWREALAECGLEASDYIRARSKEEPLPWDHIEAGVRKEFLWRERERAHAGKTTPDCRFGACGQCGACDTPSAPSLLACAGKAAHYLVNEKRDQAENSVTLDENGNLRLRVDNGGRPILAREICARAAQYRVWHIKKKGASYLSQLELQSVLQRALRRAAIPVAFSQGFHPLPLLSFGRALPVGVESEAEWFGLALHTRLAPARLLSQLNATLPPELGLCRAELMPKRLEQAISETYKLCLPSGEVTRVVERFSAFASLESRILMRETKSGLKEVDIRPFLLSWKISLSGDETALIFNTDWSEGYLSPLLLVKTILELPADVSSPGLTKLRQTFANGAIYGLDAG